MGSWLERLGLARHAAAEEPLCEPGFIERLETLRLLFAKASGLHEGGHLGAFKGGQLEFQDYRAYAPGDDFRRVDWNIYCRLDRLFVKEFAREEAARVGVWVDASASMSFGSPSKWRVGRQVAAMLAHIALCSHDAAELGAFTEGAQETLGPLTAPQQIHRAIEFLSGLRSGGPSDLRRSASDMLSRGAGRACLFVVSDFWQEEADVAAFVSLVRTHGHQLMGIHVLSPEELALPASGDLSVRDSETGEQIALSLGLDAAQAYAQDLDAHLRAVERAFVSRGARYARIATQQSLEDILIRALKARRVVA